MISFQTQHIIKFFIPFLGLLSFLILSACGGGGGYRDIKPQYTVNNSPIPVPYPRSKPFNNMENVSSSVRASRRKAGNVVINRGDTIYGIARREGVEMSALISVNNIKPPYKLTPGDQLKLPQVLFHNVKKGDTGYSISRRYGLDLTTLIKINGLKKPYSLRIGQKIKLPGYIKIQNTTTPPKRPQLVANSNERRVLLPEPSRPGSSVRSQAMPTREASRFLWPVLGGVLSNFGPKEGGLHNDGINIKGLAGGGVRAAEAGIVAYSGAGIRGFGNLLLIRHSGGWVTAYAHNEELLVEKGDKVKRGQSIAKVGQSGNVDTPQVHFEIRKGKDAVNPVQYLTRQRTGNWRGSSQCLIGARF